MVLECTLQQSSILKKSVEAMKDLCKDVNFDCSERGLQVQSMDNSHVALVSLVLRETAFQDFKCDRPVSLGMNVDALSKVLKMCGEKDTLKVRAENNGDHVSFMTESSGEDKIAEFDLKLMEIESEHMEIPEQTYKCVAKLPSAEFLKIVKDLKEFGETMQISASKDGVKFSVQGDLGGGNVMLKPRDSDKMEEAVSVIVHEPVVASFALRYLNNFAKAAPLCGQVEMGMGSDMPLSVKYSLDNEENGHIQFHLAPKVDE
jgi:proliferating cell nuclear antigen